ncbi:MAG: hypothetical protein KBA61_02085 [Spirochaetes bacterium]|nr:hypothetical protein [Spirochaetota bacterium]
MTTVNEPQMESKVPFYKGPWMAVVFIVGTVGLALWMMLARVWPASVLIEKQAQWFDGRYYSKATFAVLWIGIVVAVFAAVAVIGKIMEVARGEIRQDR